MVFGYDVSPGADAATPLPEDAANDELMPDPEAAVCPFDPGTEGVCTLRAAPLHIIVVVSLVCCKERFDFAPGNALGAARLYPLLMIVHNSAAVETVSASVTLRRPAKEVHTEMDNERMSSHIGSALFTDRNDIPLTQGVPIEWSDIFAYYWCDPPPGTYTVVKHSDRSRKEMIEKRT